MNTRIFYLNVFYGRPDLFLVLTNYELLGALRGQQAQVGVQLGSIILRQLSSKRVEGNVDASPVSLELHH